MHSAELSAAIAEVLAQAGAEAAGNTHRDHEIKRMLAAGPPARDGVSPQTVAQVVRTLASPGSIATVDAGAHMPPAMSLRSVEEPAEILISSGLATMGFAVPAAVGAALARPGRQVVCFTGDGVLGMSLAKLETLNRLQLPVTVVVFNDARLASIAVKTKAEKSRGVRRGHLLRDRLRSGGQRLRALGRAGHDLRRTRDGSRSIPASAGADPRGRSGRPEQIPRDPRRGTWSPNRPLPADGRTMTPTPAGRQRADLPAWPSAGGESVDDRS
jgi:Thiamine pyrophosphate enzyme, C-terminal TPP binding domain